MLCSRSALHHATGARNNVTPLVLPIHNSDRQIVFKGGRQKNVLIPRTRLSVALEPLHTQTERENLCFEQDVGLHEKFSFALEKKKLVHARTALSKIISPSILSYNKLMQLCVLQRKLHDCWNCYNELLERGLAPNNYTYSILLNLCIKSGDFDQGREVLETLKKDNRITMDEVLYNLAIRLFMLTNHVSEAREMLQQMEKEGINPTVVTYNVLIGTYGRRQLKLNGNLKVAVAEKIFEEMKSKGIMPDLSTYLSMIRVAVSALRIDLAKSYVRDIMTKDIKLEENVAQLIFHAFINKEGLKRDDGRGSLCWKLFKHLRKNGAANDVETLGELMRVYVSIQRWDLVFGVWDYCVELNIWPRHTVYSILFRHLHTNITPDCMTMTTAMTTVDMMHGSRTPVTAFVYRSIIELMVKNCDVDNALKYLQEMRVAGLIPNKRVYNLCLGLVVDTSLNISIFDIRKICNALLADMKESCVSPDEFTYRCLIKASIRSASWNTFVTTVEKMRKDNINPLLKTSNLILSGYSKMENTDRGAELAWKYFNDIQRSGLQPSVITYTVMINVCVITKQVQKGIKLFKEMVAEGIQPTVQTYTTLMNLFGSNGDLDMVFELFSEIKQHGLEQNKIAFCCLISACGICNQFDKAEQAFEEMKRQRLYPYPTEYGAIIVAAGNCKREDKIVEYLEEAKSAGLRLTSTLYNAALKALIDCESYEKAGEVVGEMTRKGFHAGDHSIEALCKAL